MIRLYIDHPLDADRLIDPTPDQSHYLQTVMRLGPGDGLLLFNGVDGEWLGRLEGEDRKRRRIRLETKTKDQPSPPRLELLTAMVRRARLETIVEKAVELGVGRIRLLRTRRTNYDRPNLDRLGAIAREAAEQTGRLDLPVLHPPQSLEAAADLGPGGLLVFCDEAGDDPSAPWGGSSGRAAPILDGLALAAAGRGGRMGVLIGPEGGFDAEERAYLRSLSGVTPVSLGPRILRADTAAIAALALLQASIGDWR